MEKVEVKVDPSFTKELVVGSKIFRSSCDYHVTERDLEKAQKELKETEEKRRTCLKELKNLLSEDKRIRYRMDDYYLLRFLRFRKFDVQKTYKFIKQFYIMRNEDPLLFTLPPDVEYKMERSFVGTVPYRNDNGELVYIYRMGDWNPSELSVRDFCIMFSYASDIITMNPHIQIDGTVNIFDFGGFSAKQMAVLLHPPNIKVWSKVTQEVYPYRVRRVIAFNVNPMLYAGIYIIRCCFKKKIAERFVLIRSDLKELHKYVNPEILPKKYGGKLDDEECSSYLNKVILSNKEYLKYENSFIGYKEQEQ